MKRFFILAKYKKAREIFSLFFTGFIQVSLVASNSYFISREKYLPAFFVGIAISFFWSYNVKKIAFGDFLHRVSYAFGAGIGTIIGLYLSAVIAKHF